MILTFRPIKVWPDDWKPARHRRPSAPFGAKYHRTLEDLDREIRHLGGSEPFLQLDVNEADLRLDGQLRSSAVANHPGVILTFQTRKHGPLTYSTDAFDHWHGNLRAIALGLDCLRRVERYGIGSKGQQYAGYRELPSGIALGTAMTLDEAARLLAEESDCGYNAEDLLIEVDHADSEHEWISVAYRMACKKHHPDAGGDPEMFRRLTAARDLLVAS